MNIPTFTLRNGLQLPAIGFGTSGIKGKAGIQTLTAAINNGYRLIDTAYNYENEGTIGQAIQQSSINRNDLVISSKLPGRYQSYQAALTTIEESLYRLHLDYFDLYLIHWPNPMRDEYVSAWQALLEAKKRGLVRTCGVSNFLPEYLDRLQKETGELPEVNQVELHPLFSQKEQRQYDQKHQILTEAWSPLGGIGMGLSQPIRQLPLIKQLGQKYHKDSSQIILRWEYQLGVLPLPLAHGSQHQLANLDIFDFNLTSAEVAQITTLDQNNARVSGQDPKTHLEL
ncbi:aldo/keto reductase [Lactobacillus sp. ESL0677]|uniref:aldo/keto reductase n=1 Tax=Lactobacillus sp. ESL0677 TaxID=2983208 RepID=UPI0023F810E7|nr:aldo/keto reductase [Lactobacillus sp. ESL0677]WEV37084.1 aldo/keto reductase [Lactobacillus sp. ESL0677]